MSEGGGGGLLAHVIVKMKLQSEGRDPEHASREGSVDMEVLDQDGHTGSRAFPTHAS